MDYPIIPSSPRNLAKRLKHLHLHRKEALVARKERTPVRRRALTLKQRSEVLAKTARRCHVCGGKIREDWAADHVFAHAHGGKHALDNYLPAHGLCNGKRWFYSPEEFQWILKIGVWARKEIEEQTPIGRQLTERFWRKQKSNASR